MKLFNLSLILFILLIIGCNKQKVQPNIYLEKLKSLEFLSDSSYLANVHCISYKNNSYFLSDYTTHRLIKLKENLNVDKIFGGYGGGPGEFRGASYFALFKDSIYAFDMFGKRINVYNANTGYAREFNTNVSLDLINRFAVDPDGNLYLSTNYEKKPITKIDNNGNIVSQFGNWFQKDGKINKLRNSRHISIIDSLIISVGVMVPEIELYDLKGNLVSNYDLSSIKDFNSILKYQEEVYKTNNNDNIAYDIINDIYLENNSLFILFSTYDFKNDVMSSNQIIQLKVEGINLIPQKVLELVSGEEIVGFQSICINNDTLIAFERLSGKLNVFLINEL